MAGRVPEHVIQQIVRSVDFVRLAGRYCDLKKKGKNFWALCPFHKEKTPSFSVDPENGLYHCFGCKEGGNVFTFLQAMEGLSFGEALRKLAAEAGVDLSQYETTSGPSQSEMPRLREINELATSFFQKCLEKAKASGKARDYLAQRGISTDSAETWRLGFAPEGWDHFLKCAVGRGYEPELIARAGLVIARQGAPGYYDRFRNRLMFPISDASGRTIGFGARALDPGDEPKYLNSPETPLFRKGSCSFGLAQAKEAIRSGKTAAVLEGYTDVIMAHQCGVPETVAVLGTALTEDHGRVLSRLCERVILVFDPDQAGQKSAKRSIEVLLNEDLEIRVVSLPEGQDPCDYIVAHGGEEFRKRLEESQGFFEFRLATARAEHDTATVEGRMAALRDVGEVALAVRDEARRDVIVRWIAQELGIRESSAWAYVARNVRRPAGATAATADQDDGKLSADRSLPRELLGLLLSHPEFVGEAAERLDVELLQDCAEKSLVKDVLSRHGRDETVQAERFLSSLNDAALASAAVSALAEEKAREGKITAVTLRERFEDYVNYLAGRELAATTTPPADDDEQLKQYIRKLEEKDRKSSQRR